MSPDQLQQFDAFLDENDWDIYYWATQEPTPTSVAYAEGAGPDLAAPEVQGIAPADAGTPHGVDPTAAGKESFDEVFRQDRAYSGEWAQTAGRFKPAYRPVPQRWKNSEILARLRSHVKSRSAGGVVEAKVDDANAGKGMGFMPELRNYDRA